MYGKEGKVVMEINNVRGNCETDFGGLGRGRVWVWGNGEMGHWAGSGMC